MPIFMFDASHSLGKVRAVDTRRVNIQVNTDEDLRKARVGQLVALSLPGAIEEWLIGIIDKVIKTPVLEEQDFPKEDRPDDTAAVALPRESVLNTVQLTLVGTVGLTVDNKPRLSRSLVQVPEIDGTCHVLRDAQLQAFMNLLSAEGKTDHALEIGRYTIDENAKAYLDGNKLFQRHASLREHGFRQVLGGRLDPRTSIQAAIGQPDRFRPARGVSRTELCAASSDSWS